MTLAAAAMACLMSASTAAQLTLPKTPQAETPASEWQPPSLADLPLDWWKGLTSESGNLDDERYKRFLASMKERVNGLDADNLVAAQNGLASVENLHDLLVVQHQAGAPEEFAPVSTQDVYHLDDVLALQAQWRDLQRDAETTRLQAAQSQRQLELLRDRRDSLLQDYQTAPVESPRRLLSGIERVAARIEYELNGRPLESSAKGADDSGRVSKIAADATSDNQPFG